MVGGLMANDDERRGIWRLKRTVPSSLSHAAQLLQERTGLDVLDVRELLEERELGLADVEESSTPPDPSESVAQTRFAPAWAIVALLEAYRFWERQFVKPVEGLAKLVGHVAECLAEMEHQAMELLRDDPLDADETGGGRLAFLETRLQEYGLSDIWYFALKDDFGNFLKAKDKKPIHVSLLGTAFMRALQAALAKLAKAHLVRRAELLELPLLQANRGVLSPAWKTLCLLLLGIRRDYVPSPPVEDDGLPVPEPTGILQNLFRARYVGLKNLDQQLTDALQQRLDLCRRGGDIPSTCEDGFLLDYESLALLLISLHLVAPFNRDWWDEKEYDALNKKIRDAWATLKRAYVKELAREKQLASGASRNPSLTT